MFAAISDAPIAHHGSERGPGNIPPKPRRGGCALPATPEQDHGVHRNDRPSMMVKCICFSSIAGAAGAARRERCRSVVSPSLRWSSAIRPSSFGGIRQLCRNVHVANLGRVVAPRGEHAAAAVYARSQITHVEAVIERERAALSACASNATGDGLLICLLCGMTSTADYLPPAHGTVIIFTAAVTPVAIGPWGLL
jgi:hypothetical protein